MIDVILIFGALGVFVAVGRLLIERHAIKKAGYQKLDDNLDKYFDLEEEIWKQ